MARRVGVSEFQRMMTAEREADSEAETERRRLLETTSRRRDEAVAGQVVDVNPDGTVADIRPAEMTPDRGDVTKTYTVTDDDMPASKASAHIGPVSDVIPSQASFGTAPYLDAPELAKLAERLIDAKRQLADLDGLRIVYRWKAKGGTSKGWPRLAGIERVSGQTLAFIAGPAPDLLVWLAADTLRESAVTERQIEAILFDQLVSVEWSDGDEDGDPTWRLVGPEVQCRLATLEEYGAFTRKLEAAQKAFVQPSLFSAEDRGERFSQEEAERVISMAARAYADGAGVLVHDDGTPLTDAEIAEMERREMADDDGLDAV